MHNIKRENKNALKKYYTLTYPQLSIWQTEKVFPNTSFGNIVGIAYLKGELDFKLLEEVINSAVEKNDGYRIRIIEKGNGAKQYFKNYEYFKVDFIDFSNSGGENAFNEWSRQKTQEPFNLIDSDLFYFAVFKTGNNEYGLYVKVHHIISDAWGTITQISKIVESYSNFKHGIKTNMQEGPSYIDFIKSENEYINSEKYKNNKNFWKTKFETIPEFMSLKTTGTEYKNTKSARKTFVLTKDLSSSINEFCAANRCSPFTVFFAVLFTYISRITSKSDIVLGTPILNRSNAKEKNTVGMFINVLPVRLNVDPNENFISFIKYLSRELLTLIRNQRYPFTLIQSEFRNRHNLSTNLIDVVLSYQNAKIDRTEFTGDYKLVWQENGYQVNSLQIHVNDREGEGEYTIDFDYLVDVFKKDEINSMVNHFINLLSNAIKQPTKLLCELNMLSEYEKKQILEKFNDTYKEYPKDKTIHELFEEQVQKNTDNIALVYENKTLTYAELDRKANVIAHVLRKKGIKPDEIVGIMVERSIEMIVGILGILKAGGSYFPLDNTYPKERINYMIKDSGCKIILIKTDSYINADFDGEYIFIDKEILYNKTVSNINNVCTSNNLAYLIYTSGSTGTPKGVMVEHRGIANLKIFFEENMGITSNDRIIQFFSCSFDAFVWEIFMALLTGASLYIVPRDVINNYMEFEKFLNEKKISVVTLPPFYLANLNPDNITSLKKLVTAGSSINYGLMKKWSNKVLYFNAYGPTETTICASVWKCEDPNTEMSTVPIGRPIYNTKIFIVSREGALQPVGVPGELCIAGDTLARGYINRKDLTDEKFVPCPFMQEGLMYKTGDLAKWLPDGNIEFLGRLDNQVKVRGFRIELGEIESKLIEHDKIKEVAVIAKEIREGDNCLYAYYVTTGETLETNDLREYLSKKLPFYMIPSYFIQLEEMPFTHSGKIDRKALIVFDKNREKHFNYSPPTNEVEAKLVKYWQKVMNMKRIGIDDNIFDLGADSLSIMQVLTYVLKYKWNISMQDFYECQTIRSLSDRILNNQGNSDYSEMDINNSNIINPKMEEISVFYRSNVKNVLLTGATGFLGAHVLRSILDDTQATVYCLVREIENDYSERRLKRILEYYFGNKYNSLFNKRIFVLSGDITLEKFGFDNNRYVDLSKKVDVVIHAAAIVKHFGNYSEFENINIKGTQKIIDFCMLSGARLNHISTISISGDLFEQKNKGITFTEKDFCVGQNIGDNVYVKSKFIAEKKIFEAVNKGLNASIYRVGNLTGRYSDGFFQNNIDDNRFYNMLKFFISVGTIPNDIYYREVELTPVDICAKVILELAKLDNGQISVFHVYNNKNVIMKEIIAVFNSFGKNVIVVDNKSYQEYIEKIINDDTKNKMLIKVINDLYKDSINNTASFVEVSCKITEEILRRLGINWPDINKEYLEKVFKHMKKIGFIS